VTGKLADQIQVGFPGIYTPRTNGNAERFIQTTIRKWAYARRYENSAGH
jgi:hypothetical protein